MSEKNPLQQVELILVRHGQTDWNIERRFQGHTDIPLNKVGIDQARALAAAMNGKPIATVYSSDLSRAVQTASILAENRGAAIMFDQRLREIYMGAWEGRTWMDVKTNLPNEIKELRSNPVFSRAEGGESLAELADRLRDFADDMAKTFAGKTVLVVSHGLSVSALHCLADGIPLGQARDLVPENCTPVCIKWPRREE